MTTAIEQTLETYGIENWGAGYFGINRKGNLVVHPSETDQSRAADVREIVEDLRRRGIHPPVLLRFPHGEYVPVSGNGRRLLLHGYSRIWAVESRR